MFIYETKEYSNDIDCVAQRTTACGETPEEFREYYTVVEVEVGKDAEGRMLSASMPISFDAVNVEAAFNALPGLKAKAKEEIIGEANAAIKKARNTIHVPNSSERRFLKRSSNNGS